MNNNNDSTQNQFEQLIKELSDHCLRSKYSSSSLDYTNCEGYRQLKQMGVKILPLVRKIYSSNYLSKRNSLDNCSNYLAKSNIKYKISNYLEKRDIALEGIEIVRDLVLVRLVSELCGQDFKIPQDIRGKIEEMKQFTIQWLDDNIDKYMGENQNESND